MNELSVTVTGQDRQEAFWAWTNNMVLNLVKGLADQTLALEMQAHLAARWNERSANRHTTSSNRRHLHRLTTRQRALLSIHG